MKKSILIMAMGLGLVSGSLFAQTPKMGDTIKKATSTTTTSTDTTSVKDIYATLANVAEETTLVAAIKTAGLDTDLKGPGPFTVLAPNNDAFTNNLSSINK